ncbi:hypothetical protein PAB09_00990 [Corynebacterium sp. SCR221107]|uniref:hypothetical protein n=1 Tax=Corynebacterium sp. SCR221107 TaxID=3017361 RepID=UPI0022EC286E|nr:hypothetical protein [Corynebacterium sp. SCR221107]WBT08962.1 hypothetical protein PAB09_00990 [Corynebacterium sp. SCR221107]
MSASAPKPPPTFGQAPRLALSTALAAADRHLSQRTDHLPHHHLACTVGRYLPLA